MIYTVTFNPSLDYIVRVDDFKPGVINRTTYENILPGGKGINVSIVLSNLGHKSVALGFMAGFTGDDIAELMKNFGCGVDLIRVREGSPALMSNSSPARRLRSTARDRISRLRTLKSFTKSLTCSLPAIFW